MFAQYARQIERQHGGSSRSLDDAEFRRLVDEAKARHNLSDIVGRHTKLRRRGPREMNGLCPFHVEKSPSFEVNDGKGTWHCWGGCGGGDAMSFLMRADGLTFMEAYRVLAGDDFPVVSEADRAKRKVEDAAIVAQRVAIGREIWARSVDPIGTPAQVYARSRGITMALPDTVRFAMTPRWRNPETGEVGRDYPAMVCALQDVADDVVGVQCVFLADGGRRKYERIRQDGTKAKAKLSYGTVIGSAFRASGSRRSYSEALDNGPVTEVVITEGPENSLTLAQGLPTAHVYAACGTAMMPRLDLPASVRSVVLAGDNDNAGRVAVAAAAQAFEARGLTQRAMFPDPAYGDWNDELRGVRGMSASPIPLHERMAGAKPFAALAAEPVTVIATPYQWREPSQIKPREWVYGRSIQRGHVRAILAPGAAGKTILSVGEALAMATGRNLLGQEVPGGPKRVWLWNLEDDGEELARIIQAACKHWSIGPEHIRDNLFVDSALEGAILKLATSTAAEGLVINRPLVAGLTDEMLARAIDYLHVDPFVSSHTANENDNMEIDAIAKEWAMVAKNAKAGVGLAHHVSKAGAADVTALSGRGAVALINACRSVMVLNRMSDEEARSWGIEDERRRRFFRMYDDKNNRAPPSDKSDWFTMASVSLGNGVNDDGDSIGVVVPWSPPDAFEGVTADHLLTVQRAVAGVAGAQRYRADAQAKAWVGKIVADVFGLSSESSVKADRARINKLLGTWFATGALLKADGKDDKSNDRTFVEVGTWAVQDVAPTSSGGVRNGGEGVGLQRPHPTCPPIGAGVGKVGAGGKYQGGEKAGGEPFGNPALDKSAVVFPEDGPFRSTRGMILAPGEAGDDGPL